MHDQLTKSCDVLWNHEPELRTDFGGTGIGTGTETIWYRPIPNTFPPVWKTLCSVKTCYVALKVHRGQ